MQLKNDHQSVTGFIFFLQRSKTFIKIVLYTIERTHSIRSMTYQNSYTNIYRHDAAVTYLVDIEKKIALNLPRRSCQKCDLIFEAMF